MRKNNIENMSLLTELQISNRLKNFIRIACPRLIKYILFNKRKLLHIFGFVTKYVPTVSYF